MRIIKPSINILPQETGIIGAFKQIERAGRICYKSEDNITESSHEEFVNRMIKSNHLAMLEHGTVYLYLEWDNENYKEFSKLKVRYSSNKYSKIYEKNTFPHGIYITTNYRVLVENNWLEDLKYICDPTNYHHKTISIIFTTQIAITREFNRHRVNSMAESSTRYCDQSKDKFGNELSINLPDWVREDLVITTNKESTFIDYCSSIAEFKHENEFIDIDYWLFANLACEFSYMNLRRLGRSPQEARVVLPLDTNSELIHTAYLSDWKHFLELRTANSAHPDARNLAKDLENQLITLKYI